MLSILERNYSKLHVLAYSRWCTYTFLTTLLLYTL